MSLRRYNQLLRIAMVWIVILSLAVDTASACWWLKCRRSRRCCEPVCSSSSSAPGSADMASDGPTEATSPTDEDGWRPQNESETAGYDEGEEAGESTVPAELVMPVDEEPAVVPEGDPLNELFVEGEDPAGDVETPGSNEEEEDLFGSEEADEEFIEEEIEEELAEETEDAGDVAEEEDLFGSDEEEAADDATDEGDLFGSDDTEEGEDLFGEEETVDPLEEEDLFGGDEEPADDDLFGAEPDDPAAEPGAEEEDDLFGPAEEEEDLFGPADEEPADDLFGPVEEEEVMEEETDDLFGPADEEEPADDLFGGDAEEDLFGGEEAVEEETDDLFGPVEEEVMEEETDDLFGPADDAADDAADDLFGPIEEEEVMEEETDDLFGPTEEESMEEESDPADDLFGAAPVPAEALGMRSWVDNTGLYTTNGRLLVIGEDYVQLLKDNGNTTTVPLRRLSDADQLLIEQVVAAYGLGELNLVASR